MTGIRGTVRHRRLRVGGLVVCWVNGAWKVYRLLPKTAWQS